MENNENKYITKEGKKQIENELKNLISVERPKVIEEIQSAREKGDLRENSDFDAAKERQANIEERIKLLSNKLLNLKVVSSDSKVIGIGTKIKYKNLKNNKIETIIIVGSFESNPFSEVKKISINTKFAKAILKNKLEKGKIISINLDSNSYNVEILEVNK